MSFFPFMDEDYRHENIFGNISLLKISDAFMDTENFGRFYDIDNTISAFSNFGQRFDRN